MTGPAGPSRIARFAMAVAWSSFLSAGVLELLVFAVVDPGELRWFGAAPIEFSAQAIYTLSFLIFWGVIALASSLALLLVTNLLFINQFPDRAADAASGKRHWVVRLAPASAPENPPDRARLAEIRRHARALRANRR